jgi:hypothetical protein
LEECVSLMESNGDSIAYIGLPDGLKQECGLTWWAGGRCSAAPETNRTPGYPIFISLMPRPPDAQAGRGAHRTGIDVVALVLIGWSVCSHPYRHPSRILRGGDYNG